MRIKQLPTALANQIAAGEVIERPASIVKELLENSFDAKATLINIEIGYGGLNQIKISDNGTGIVADDLPLAIAPHATSKISQPEDLYAILSMGFRGEALASIASVSRLTISSKPADQTHAMKLISDSQHIRLEPCARTQGTTVDVRDVFFNVPVRKKFLKNERSEFQAIEMVVKRFALSAPDITINLSHNQKKIVSLPAAHCDQSKLGRIRKILGKAFIEQSYYIDVEHAGMRLLGWIGSETYQRSQNDKQWIYINARMVKDKLLNHAIKQAYENLLHPGRYPSCLLYLTIPAGQVDVNVHPTKHEVRFQQPRLVHDFISTQIQSVLNHSKAPKQYALLTENYSDTCQIHEPSPYPTSPITGSNIKEVITYDNKWIDLNNHFALVFLQEEPHLIDVAYLQRHWLRTFLTKENLPLKSRPLLVPVSHILEKINVQHFAEIKNHLEQMGIEVSLLGENTLFIRSLPIALPHLDFKQLLNAIFKTYPFTQSELMELLIQHQIFGLSSASQAEKETLMAYMHRLQYENNKERGVWQKQLSVELCKDLLNG
ncbi:DNA mismatch repair endonuclease MutL [Legionella clemsonensis]|uniref:DNA mismatch repair protein MutL n=1 Tax=Legionella clemsonensis TaxID=1867846 RepID=A0A222NZR3_9GAMM|nr:DNA mismatch repair endonuclease MutL [Legionella clemsonensis]ASQ45082.1 DNA mismatch repair protein MutL [Legionella clemsonensis]